MKKIEVLKAFGGPTNAAKYFGISQEAVTRWGEIIPEKRSRELYMRNPKKWKFDKKLYSNGE